MKQAAEKAAGRDARPTGGRGLRGWFGLLAGLALLWVLITVVLPWGQEQPGLGPIMAAIKASDVDVGTYWYSQSEQTAVAQNYVRNALERSSVAGDLNGK
jgi:hypothetical protein